MDRGERFPGWRNTPSRRRFAVGTLTEAAGEPVIVQPVDEASFAGIRFVFFTGTPEFAKKHAMAAERAGATVIDMTGGFAGTPGARS